jgi:hypothetical protein
MSPIERTLFVIDETRVNPELVEVALQHIITDAEMQVRGYLCYHACTYCRFLVSFLIECDAACMARGWRQMRRGAGVSPRNGGDSEGVRAFECQPIVDRWPQRRQLRPSQVTIAIMIITITITSASAICYQHATHRLHSSVPSAEQQRAFQAVSVGTLKVSLAPLRIVNLYLFYRRFYVRYTRVLFILDRVVSYRTAGYLSDQHRRDQHHLRRCRLRH